MNEIQRKETNEKLALRFIFFSENYKLMLVNDDNHEHHHVHIEALRLVYPLLEMFLLDHHPSILKPGNK